MHLPFPRDGQLLSGRPDWKVSDFFLLLFLSRPFLLYRFVYVFLLCSVRPMERRWETSRLLDLQETATSCLSLGTRVMNVVTENGEFVAGELHAKPQRRVRGASYSDLSQLSTRWWRSPMISFVFFRRRLILLCPFLPVGVLLLPHRCVAPELNWINVYFGEGWNVFVIKTSLT